MALKMLLEFSIYIASLKHKHYTTINCNSQSKINYVVKNKLCTFMNRASACGLSLSLGRVHRTDGREDAQ